MASEPRDLVLHHFYRLVRERPDDVYMTQPLGGGRTEDFTFARALDEAKRMAAHLRSLGLPPQSRIAIVSKNCAHFFLSDLAIWMAGHVSVAIFPTFDAGTLRFILEHSESKLLFVGKLDDWDEIARGIPAGLPCVAFPLAPPTGLPAWGDVVARTPPIEDEPRRSPDDWALVIYTSGSTGRPKGVVISHAAISATTHALIEMLEVTSSDRILSYLPLAHAMDRWASECSSFVSGGRVFFAESLETFVEDLKRARPTLFLSVPRLWLKFQLGVFARMPERKLSRILRVPLLAGVVRRKILKNLGLDQVRFAGSGSAPIPPELLAWYRSLGLELLEGYGMTENFNFSHVTRVGRGRAGYIGHPWEGVECKLGEDGEVLVKSPGTMIGYLGDPELTRESFTSDGFLHTGDLGVIDEEGRLMITGRVKELFKTSKGKYVAPAPIENLLNRDACVELSCVAGAGREAPHAVVQLAEHLRPAAREAEGRAELGRRLQGLLEEVNGRLATYERLAFVAVSREPWTIEEGTLTPTMKLKRREIEKRYVHELDGWYARGQKVLWQE